MKKRKCGLAFKALGLLGLFVCTSTVYLAVAPIYEPCNCSKESIPDTLYENNALGQPAVGNAWERKLHSDDVLMWGRHRLAVIVPFRDRFEELLDFIPHMHNFLNRQKVRHKFYVMNQVDVLRFNRGSLINIGYIISKNECDYLAMHDVDLIPLNANVSYRYPQSGPFHASGPDLHPRYHYPTFVGGILLLTNEHFQLVNGFSNRYFGWGKEDDEFYVRMKEANLTIHRPENITTGFNTFKHFHDKVLRPRDNRRYFDQKQKSRIRDRITGVQSVLFEETGRYDIRVSGAPATIVHVGLRCDLQETPWCIDPALHQALDDYKQNQDQLVPRDVYTKASNGSYVKVGVKYEKLQPPVDLKYFLNLNLADKDTDDTDV